MIDVASRLQALGIMGVYAEVAPMDEPETAEHTDNTPVEPKAITGLGPQGRPWGPGRFHLPDGALTLRDKARILGHVGFRRWLGENGGGEEG